MNLFSHSLSLSGYFCCVSSVAFIFAVITNCTWLCNVVLSISIFTYPYLYCHKKTEGFIPLPAALIMLRESISSQAYWTSTYCTMSWCGTLAHIAWFPWGVGFLKNSLLSWFKSQKKDSRKYQKFTLWQFNTYRMSIWTSIQCKVYVKMPLGGYIQSVHKPEHIDNLYA